MGGKRGCWGGGEDDGEGRLQQDVCQGAEREDSIEEGGHGLHLRGNRTHSGSHKCGWTVVSFQL